MHHFGDLMFTDAVKKEQARHGSREAYERMTAAAAPDALSERETAFIESRDSFYLATVTETGWPYVQHRGGPKGFLKVLSPNQLGFADYRGNRQYVSVGNLSVDPRASLFLMDYADRKRLKLLARAEILDADDAPELAARVQDNDGGRVERVFRLHVEAFDWNCPQFITPRFTAEEASTEMNALREANETLRAEIKRLRDRSA